VLEGYRASKYCEAGMVKKKHPTPSMILLLNYGFKGFGRFDLKNIDAESCDKPWLSYEWAYHFLYGSRSAEDHEHYIGVLANPLQDQEEMADDFDVLVFDGVKWGLSRKRRGKRRRKRVR
jgi:hypothetical protein